MVCAQDGVTLVQGRGGVWRHTDEIPKGVDPGHDPEPVALEDWVAGQQERVDVHLLAHELLVHHVAMHPMSGCAFATRLAEALRSKR